MSATEDPAEGILIAQAPAFKGRAEGLGGGPRLIQGIYTFPPLAGLGSEVLKQAKIELRMNVSLRERTKSSMMCIGRRGGS